MKSNLKCFIRGTIIAITVLAIGVCGDNSSDGGPSGNTFIRDANAATHPNSTEPNSQIAAFGSLEASGTLAPSFTDIEEWQPDKSYHRGDIVRINYDIYISILPSKGLIPSAEERHWDIIDYNNRSESQEKKLYRIGDVVSHEGRFYISRGMNKAVKRLRLDDERRWAEFSHPGLFYDLPPVPDEADAEGALVGVDANNNGIRDDYELAILFSDLPQQVKDSALSAGKAYGELMMVAVEEGDIDRDGALDILHKLVLAKACRTRMRELHQGAAWQESTYFDTWDRIEAKFKLQNMLANLLEPEGYDLPREQDPCAALAARGQL